MDDGLVRAVVGEACWKSPGVASICAQQSAHVRKACVDHVAVRPIHPPAGRVFDADAVIAFNFIGWRVGWVLIG